MTNPPSPDKTRELMETALGFRESAALLTAVKLDLFERVGDSPSTPEEIATEEDPDGMKRLLRVLAGMNLLVKENGLYRNDPDVETLLTSRGKVDLRPILDHFTNLYDMWGELDEAIEEGQSYEFEERNDDTFSEEFTEAMEARAHFSAEELADAVGDRLDGGRLLDLGGGSGVFARALLERDPQATGVVADQPRPLHVANKYIREANLGNRLETRELDLLEDPDYGEDFDMVLISAIVHIFGPDKVRTILERSAEALAPGGIVVVRDYLVHDDHSGPLDALLFDVLMFLATEEGQTYTEEALRAMMEEAGLRNLERVNLPHSTDDLLIGQRT